MKSRRLSVDVRMFVVLLRDQNTDVEIRCQSFGLRLAPALQQSMMGGRACKFASSVGAYRQIAYFLIPDVIKRLASCRVLSPNSTWLDTIVQVVSWRVEPSGIWALLTRHVVTF